MKDRFANADWIPTAPRGGIVEYTRPALAACQAFASAPAFAGGVSAWQAMYVAAYRSAVARVERERVIAIAIMNN